ncbi:MAG: hypothetical protein PHH49_06980 [Candidatus Omnitrophica bacterium]|nr:hypothetical protein [Candidatus Omnitrophota bacterium]MDD5488682.1 hypothetical protein [Candidatus Omnitrophota bacterium]
MPERPRSMRYYGLAAILIIIVATGVFLHVKRPLDVSVKVRPRTIDIGQTLSLRVLVSAGPGILVDEVDVVDPGDVYIRENVVDKTVSRGRQTILRRMKLTYLFPGTYTLPDVSVRYLEKGEKKEITIDTGKAAVRKILKEDPTSPEEIKTGEGIFDGRVGMAHGKSGERMGGAITAPIRYYIRETPGPRKVRTNKDIMIRSFLYLVVTPFVVAVIIVLSFAMRRAGQKLAQPAHIMAFRRFKKLKSKRFIEQGKGKQFAALLYRCLLLYLQERYDFPRRAMTTEEIVSHVNSLPKLSPEDKSFLEEKFRSLDLVKYSVGRDKSEKLDPGLEKEIGFIKRTKETEQGK